MDDGTYARDLDQFPLRLPPGMRAEIKSTAKANGRSMNAEFIHRLTVSAGIDLRDYFAAHALSGYCAVEEGWDQPADEVARAAYTIADAMLAERSK